VKLDKSFDDFQRVLTFNLSLDFQLFNSSLNLIQLLPFGVSNYVR